MIRTLKANRMSFLSPGVCCCVVFLVLCMFRLDGAQAAGSSSNSSGVTSSSDDQSDEGSTVEKGMRPFFDMVQGFLAVVQPKKIHEQSWLNLSEIVEDGDFQSEQLSDWKNWTLYLVGFLVCAAVGVLFVIVMPIIGLIFCCCRCAGRCGGKSKPQDPKRAGCKRTTYCTLLLIVNTVALAGVVCTFLSNQILYDKMRNENDLGPIGKLVNTADLLNGFVNDTIDDIDKAVLGRFLDAKDGIVKGIKDSANQAVEEVLAILNATSLLDQSKAVAQDVNTTKRELTNVANRLQFLSVQGNLLSDNLTALGDNITSVCTAALCPGVNTTKYAISANFSGLNTLGTELAKVEQALNLDSSITQAERTIESAKKNASDSVSTGVNDSTASINTVENSIRSAVDNVTTELKSEITVSVDKFRSNLKDSQDDISKYSQYVWYVGLGIACALLLVVVLYYVGILFGLCGERPGFGAQCCNTGTGSNFLMGGVGFTFILGWLIMLVCTITFVLGGPLYTELCRYFDDHQPRDLKPFSDAVMNIVDLKHSLFNGQDVDLSLVTILEDCENNNAIYNVLKLEYMVNLTKELDVTKVDTALNDLKSKSFDIPEIDILTTSMNDSFTEFANSGVDSIPFDDYNTQVNKTMTEEDLTVLANQLTNAASQQGVPDSKKQQLLSAADQLNQLQRDVVGPMQNAEDSLKTSLEFLQNQVAPGIKQSTEALRQGLQRSETDFNTRKDAMVQEQLGALADRVMVTVNTLVNDALYDVSNNVGKCRPLYDSFYSATDAACVVALEPLNGLWFSLGWCLFFFLPALIFAVKLAGLYRREHEERDFDDPNFHLYSEGGKLDSIPLTSRQQQQQQQQQQQPGGRGSIATGGEGDQVSRGMANGAYQADSPSDYPNYKGGALNAGYQDDNYRRPQGPPPYGPHGVLNGNPKSRNDRMYPY